MKRHIIILLALLLTTILSAQPIFAQEHITGSVDAEIQPLDEMDAQASDAPADDHGIDASSDWMGVIIEISDIRKLTAKITFKPSKALADGGLKEGETIRYSITHLEKKLTVFEEINKTASEKVLKITLWDGTKYEVKADLIGSDGKVIQNLGEAGFGLHTEHPTIDDQFPGMAVLFGITLIGLIAGVKFRKRRIGSKDA